MLTRMRLAQIPVWLLAIALGGCKVESQSETVPAADGKDKKALNVRVETMNREEVKDAANRAIEKTADAAQGVKAAAKSLASETTAAVQAARATREGRVVVTTSPASP